MERQRAVVVRAVTPIDQRQVIEQPLIRLEDGQEVNPIWVDRYIAMGTAGWAEFVQDRNAWKFTPDAD